MDGMGLFFKGTPRLLPASGGDASFSMQPLKGVERGIAVRRRTEIVGAFYERLQSPEFCVRRATPKFWRCKLQITGKAIMQSSAIPQNPPPPKRV